MPRADRDYAIEVGLRMIRLRRLVEQSADGLLRPRSEDLPVLRYYANSVSHILARNSTG